MVFCFFFLFFSFLLRVFVLFVSAALFLARDFFFAHVVRCWKDMEASSATSSFKWAELTGARSMLSTIGAFPPLTPGSGVRDFVSVFLSSFHSNKPVSAFPKLFFCSSRSSHSFHCFHSLAPFLNHSVVAASGPSMSSLSMPPFCIVPQTSRVCAVLNHTAQSLQLSDFFLPFGPLHLGPLICTRRGPV